MDKDSVIELLAWLKSKKYLIDEGSDTMTIEFEREHEGELSRNYIINKTIKKIFELVN